MTRNSATIHFACALAIAACAITRVAVGHAQQPQSTQTSSPRVISMPSVLVPEGAVVPESGRVEAVVVVAADGTAQLEACEASESLCAGVRDALAVARFEPARRQGTAIAARVRVALTIAAPAAPVVEVPASVAAASTPSGAPSAAVPAVPTVPQPTTGAEAEPAFSATGSVRAVQQPGMRRLELAEMRDLPGAFGDPFRAIDALPGVVPVLSGLPYVFVRGSPPASTLYIYDDIPVPLLFHLGFGPAVIHPRMVGPIRLYSGVAPTRYGRLTGGAVVGEGPEQPDGRFHGEAELRLLDATAYTQAPALGGSVTAAVRYGYPGLLLSIFNPTVSVAYWDYQLRYATELSAHDRFELVALGSYDTFSSTDDPDNGLTLTFHRLEPRLMRRVGPTEYGIALLLGWEESALGAGFKLQATRVGPRFWVEHRLSEKAKLRLSGDLIGVAGFFSSEAIANNRDSGRSRDELFGDLPARSVWGLQAELGLRPLPLLEFQLGARADAWVQGAGAEAVIDPRARLILHTSDTLDLHIAGGVVHQPAVFFIPLPGIADVATDRGLQTAIQSEAGVGWDTPLNLRAEAQVFVHHYQNLVFVDALFLEESLKTICGAIECGDVKLQDRIGGFSYGTELFLRRPVTERISGWISYTLAWSAIDDVAGIPYTPTWDVRHVGNVVAQWNMGAGFSAGARVMARSGKLHAEFLLDDALRLSRDERRLPWFTRLDLELAYAWPTYWGRLRVSLEWFNVTFAREPINLVCTGSPRTCRTTYLPPLSFPNIGVRGEI
jgi:hypothetical protein